MAAKREVFGVNITNDLILKLAILVFGGGGLFLNQNSSAEKAATKTDLQVITTKIESISERLTRIEKKQDSERIDNDTNINRSRRNNGRDNNQ